MCSVYALPMFYLQTPLTLHSQTPTVTSTQRGTTMNENGIMPISGTCFPRALMRQRSSLKDMLTAPSTGCIGVPAESRDLTAILVIERDQPEMGSNI